MGTTAQGIPYPEDTDPVMQGAQAMKALATAADTLTQTVALGQVQDVYAALKALADGAGAAWPTYPIAYTIDPEDAAWDMLPAAQDMRAACFMVRKPQATKGMGVCVSVAAAGAGSNYMGGTLFSYAADGTWTFLANTGASKAGTTLQSVGWKNWTWRDVADTADTPYNLLPGVLYVASFTIGNFATTQPRFVAGAPQATANLQINFNNPGGFKRSAVCAGIGAKRQTNMPTSAQAAAGSVPLIAIYG